MRLPRIVAPGAARGGRIALSPGDRHHLLRVLRLGAGAPVEVLDGEGRAFRAVLCGLEPPELEVLEPVASPAPEPVTLGLAILKGARMDWAVEKVSELGAERLVPLVCERGAAGARLERWRRIARESARQCGRARLLEVLEPVPATELPRCLPPGARGVRLEPSAPPLRGAPGGRHTLLAIGPEGGLTAREASALDDAGFEAASLASPVLRAETAAIAAVAVTIALARLEAVAPGSGEEPDGRPGG